MLNKANALLTHIQSQTISSEKQLFVKLIRFVKQQFYFFCQKIIIFLLLVHYNIAMTNKASSQEYCKMHHKKIIQLGSCLTCDSPSQICDAKGCIKYHTQMQNMHNVVTIEYIRNVVDNYLKSDENKKAYLKKMIHQYFTLAKKQLQTLFNQVYQAVDYFKFQRVILHEDEQKLANLLIQQRYRQIKCVDVAMILPKLIKCTNYEDGHFSHLRNYLKVEKEKLPQIFRSIILNLPYFRSHTSEYSENKYCEISSQWLREVNRKLEQLNYHPKKLRIKYSKIFINIQLMQKIQFIKDEVRIFLLTRVKKNKNDSLQKAYFLLKLQVMSLILNCIAHGM